MICELSNSFLSVGISTKGAEMHSVFSKELNKEILWQANAQIWGRHAPVLFPIVGRLKNDTYAHNGKSYTLPQHGFARDKIFTVKEQSLTHLVFELKEDETSLAVYPFRFELQIAYRLEDNRVFCTYHVANPAEENLLFSIGAHPGFICPLFDNETLNDYSIQLQKEEIAERVMLENGLTSNLSEKVITQTNTIALNRALFQKDAIVFTNLRSNALEMLSPSYSLHFSWHNMPYFGIWTKKEEGAFICLEPWAGIADHINASGVLSGKEGIISLPPHQHFICGFSFEPRPAHAE